MSLSKIAFKQCYDIAMKDFLGHHIFSGLNLHFKDVIDMRTKVPSDSHFSSHIEELKCKSLDFQFIELNRLFSYLLEFSIFFL